MEFLFELVGEVLFQLLFELLGAVLEAAWGGSSRLARASLRVLLYFTLGVGLGALSVLFLPHPLFLKAPNAIVSLALVPLAVGSATVALCRFVEQRSEWETLCSRFFYSFFFAFTFAGTRYYLL